MSELHGEKRPVLGLGKRNNISEFEARGETARVYFEIMQTLRVSGISSIFKEWATYDSLFPIIWEAIRPNLETRFFENGADELRSKAASAAEALGRLDVRTSVALGDSQEFQLRGVLDVYLYVDPKLLLLTSAIEMALEGIYIGSFSSGPQEKIARGVPTFMQPMEIESESTPDRAVARTYRDIIEALSLNSILEEYRSIALWPDYFINAWERLKPISTTETFIFYCTRLRECSRNLARKLPYPLHLGIGVVKDAGVDPAEFRKLTTHFEQILPASIIHIALCKLDFQSGPNLAASPFPAASQLAFLKGTHELA